MFDHLAAGVGERQGHGTDVGEELALVNAHHVVFLESVQNQRKLVSCAGDGRTCPVVVVGKRCMITTHVTIVLVVLDQHTFQIGVAYSNSISHK